MIFEKEGVAVIDTDPESSSFAFLDAGISIQGLVPEAETTDYAVEAGLRYEFIPPSEDFKLDAETWLPYLVEWRQATSRKYPPAYRIKIRIEYEETTEEETARYWYDRFKNEHDRFKNEQ